MPSFAQLFINSKGQPVEYNGLILVLADKFPVSNGDKIKITIEKTNSHYTQGISIDITGSCELQGKLWKIGKGVKMIFWEDTEVLDPKNIELTIFTKTGFIWVQNIWEKIGPTGLKSVDAGHSGAAMIVEEIQNGRHYRCNDRSPDENFDDIVFTVQRVPK